MITPSELKNATENSATVAQETKFGNVISVCEVFTNTLFFSSHIITAMNSEPIVPVTMNNVFRYSVFNVT